MDEMTPEDKQALVAYWEQQLTMMATEAWTEYVKEVQSQIKIISNVAGIKNGEHLNLVKGQLYVLENIVARKDIAHRMLDQLNTVGEED